MRLTPKFLDRLRREASDLENHVVDEFLAGRLDRRSLLREGSRLGLAMPLMAGLLGSSFNAGRALAQTGKKDATIRVASTVPATAVDPVITSNSGALIMLQQTGEFLVYDQPDLVLKPMLALSWKANEDGTVWTFKLRPNVKFHSGHVLNADDVVATMNRLADPANGSNALSAFKGVLAKGGTRKVDDLTVEFHLNAPNGNFPYIVSSDNYNAIILPADYAGDFEKTFNGTGPFKLEKYTAKVGASFVRNDDYWGEKAFPARTEFTFFADQQPMVLALQGQQVDVVQQISVQGAQGILNDPEINIIKIKSAVHREFHLRNDVPKLADKRVRQAIALTLDRDAIVAGLFRGLGTPGNDSPFAPVYPSTDKAVPQRKKDIPAAKALMAAAGKSGGFEATLTTERVQEIPDYAVLIQNAVAEIGIKLNLKIETDSAYYGKAQPGQSDWLDSEMGITDYGHRGVPNVLLGAPLLSTGSWNAAHFKNPDYDKLVADYVATTDLTKQRELAGKIQTLLLDETPILFAYFYNYIAATAANVSGVKATAISQVFLAEATVS
jgi:peptide/nickel transport system substrate-binding protein